MPNYSRDVPDAVLTPREKRALVQDMQPGDQIFQNQRHGLFNAGLMGRLLLAHPRWFSGMLVELDPELVKYCETMVQLNLDLVRTMTKERMDEPIYAVTMPDDTAPVLLIDGHHRIVRRAWSGCTEVRCYLADTRATAMIQRVKFMR